MTDFRLWLEQNNQEKPAVFVDMDETILHRMEKGWMKEAPENKNLYKSLVPGSDPYPKVKLIHIEGEDRYIFPRPGALEFLEELDNIADVFILSHHEKKKVGKTLKALGWNKYVKEYYSTKDLGPNDLGKKYNLENRKWVLVDNLDVHSIEITNKLRILGLAPGSNPQKIISKILSDADEHFVKVVDWVPTIDEYDDYDLWRAIPKIKNKLGMDFRGPGDYI